METDIINMGDKLQHGGITIKRKVDTVQIIRHPAIVLSTLTPEEAIKLAENLEKHASLILKATAKLDA